MTLRLLDEVIVLIVSYLSGVDSLLYASCEVHREEKRKKVSGLGSFYCPFKVTSPYGNILHHLENTTHGQFAFTTSEAGNYLACFWVDGHNPGGGGGGGGASVNIDWKTGIAAKDWESVARKEKIEGVELELRKLEGAVEAIHENLLHLKSREAGMRTTSEATNAQVAWFSIMSLGICVMVSITQISYLKRYFQKKKLI